MTSTIAAEELLWHLHEYTIPAALALLPGRMTSPAAKAMLLAIGLQESKFEHRVQAPTGPAHGFWQFERAGVKGVLEHRLTAPLIQPILALLAYDAPGALLPVCYEAITHNDVLACVCARLLLWTDPRALPAAHEPGKGWAIYVDTWKPGTPIRSTWHTNYGEGWRLVTGA